MNPAQAAPRQRRYDWPAWPEVALGACMVGLAVFTAIVAEGDKVVGEREPTTWWEWLLIVSPALPVAFRRVAPLAATPVTIIAQIVLWGIGLATAFFAPLVMIYTVCAEAGERGRRMGIVSSVALCTMTFVGVFVAPDVTADLVVFVGLASALAYMLGTRAAQGRVAAVALAEELAVARIERDLAQERAAVDERQRIARELHDIVGHSLSVIAVRAEAADRVAPKNPAAAVDAVGAIASIARSSLAEVRRVLAGLRDDAEVDLAPLPSLASVPALITSFSSAGLAVTLECDLPADDAVGAAVGAGAYRIVQEALTNVLKHGGAGVEARLSVEVVKGQLRLQIDDDGRGAIATIDNDIDGLGLTGMRERAEVLGGHFDSGPRPGGGYRVRVTLPVERSATSAARGGAVSS